jgi:hypothetical protein
MSRPSKPLRLPVFTGTSFWTAEDSDDAIFQLYLLIRRLYLKKTDASLSAQNVDPPS